MHIKIEEYVPVHKKTFICIYSFSGGKGGESKPKDNGGKKGGGGKDKGKEGGKKGK